MVAIIEALSEEAKTEYEREKSRLEQSEAVYDLQDAVDFMYEDCGGVTLARINHAREILDRLEKSLEDMS